MMNLRNVFQKTASNERDVEWGDLDWGNIDEGIYFIFKTIIHYVLAILRMLPHSKRRINQ